MIGQVFGRLTVIADGGRDKDHRKMFLCHCACGEERRVEAYNLKCGHSKSCGCQRTEANNKRLLRHGAASGRHMTTEYSTWISMKTRCINPHATSFANYGQRGISVCDRWSKSFQAFLEDMGPRPSPKHSLDRINNDGNYEPSNCRWATVLENANNKRNCIRLSYDGQTHTLAEWSRIIGISDGRLRERLRRGLSIDEVVAAVKKKRRP